MTPETAALVAAGDAPKGDVLGVARIAGIQGGKRTSELIPLCHPLALSFLGVEASVDVDAGEITIIAEARTTGPTGVEMEALTAASVAALTVYDMVKGVQRGAEIASVALESQIRRPLGGVGARLTRLVASASQSPVELVERRALERAGEVGARGEHARSADRDRSGLGAQPAGHRRRSEIEGSLREHGVDVGLGRDERVAVVERRAPGARVTAASITSTARRESANERGAVAALKARRRTGCARRARCSAGCALIGNRQRLRFGGLNGERLAGHADPRHRPASR